MTATRNAAAFLAALIACQHGVPRLGARDAVGAVPSHADGTVADRVPAARSPHWPDARVMVSDYRIQYQADSATRAREYDWAAAHFDRVVLDRGDTISAPEYRRRNPTIAIYRYALLWTVTLPGEEKRDEPGVSYYTDMTRWYAARPRLVIETAFLHDARLCPPPAPVAASCRVKTKIWTQERWVTNPGDAGARAYHMARLAALAAGVEGIFVDEHGSGDFAPVMEIPLREYARHDDYQRDVVVLLGEARRALGGDRRILLNTAEWHTPWDRAMIAAAGGTHAEHMIDATGTQTEERWRFLDRVIADGGIVDASPKRELPSSYTAGNSATPEARRELWQVASYYMLVSARDPGAVAFNPGPKWDRPYAERWIAGIERDLGAPVGARTVGYEVNAPTGKGRARVWMRELARAVVLVRPADEAGAGEFGDGTGVTIPFVKNGLYRPMAADGSIGAPLDRLVLRAGEAAVLLKPSAGR
ncbi:MAG: hypothetical protein HOQ09_12885 [Gemmatimonadaceae bacterium]|nr:hypothetical protein [Gemmatimonadaceae bacterium]